MANQAVPAPRLAANYVLLSVGEFIAKVSAAVGFAYLARVLGPEGYGHLEFAIAVIFFFTLFVDNGLNAYGAREIAKDRSGVTRFAGHIVFVRCLLAAGAFVLLAVFVRAIEKPWAVKQLILLYGVTLLGSPGLLQGVFQGLDWMHYVATASVIRWMTFAAGVFVFVRSPEQVWLVPLVEGSAIGIVVAFYLWSVCRSFGSLRQPIDWSFAFSLFRQALPIGASDLVWAIKVYFATVWLGMFVGGAEVGWFGAAHRIVISLHTFAWLYSFNLLPSMARCTQHPIDALQRLMQESMTVAASSAVFLGVVGTAFAQPLIALLYGDQYRQAVTLFQVLIWLVPLRLVRGHFSNALIAYGRQRFELLSTACGAGLNVFLTLLLAPAYGPTGAAWALIASELLTWGLAYGFVRRTIARVPLWPRIYRPLLAGAALVGVLSVLPTTNVLMAGSSAVVVYCSILAIIQPEVFNDVRSMFARTH